MTITFEDKQGQFALTFMGWTIHEAYFYMNNAEVVKVTSFSMKHYTHFVTLWANIKYDDEDKLFCFIQGKAYLSLYTHLKRTINAKA